MVVIISKFLIAIFGLLIGYILLKNEKYKDFKLSQFIIYGFLIRWIILSFWFFFFEGRVSGDVYAYELHINWVLEGKVPNRDFSTPYGFYLNYILSIPYILFKNPVTIMLMLQIFELIGFCLFYLSIKKILSIYRANLFALLYITNPLVIGWLAFDGQDESLMIFAFGGIFYAISHSRGFFNSFFSSFSLFAVKITALAAVIPVIMVSSRKEILRILLLIFIFLLIPLILNSKVLGFGFEWKHGVDDLTEYFFPGNIWFLIDKFYQNENLLLYSRFLTLLLFFIVSLFLFKFKNLISKPIFISFGVCLFTFSFQIGSSYVSPGFIATIIPFLIFLLLINRILNYKYIYFFNLYSLIIPFDLVIYLIWDKNYKNILSENLFYLIFYPYEILIISSNIFIYFILIRFFLKIANKNVSINLNY
tara:strand:+ start:4578 stop:5837 length:1260 start_codon:yes stop_codon:yes gene_type:complete